MNKKSSHNSKAGLEQAASNVEILKLGLDVHAEFIVVVRMLDHSTPQPPQRFTPQKFLEWIPSQIKTAKQVHSCYEAGPFGYVLHRKLTELGVRNYVIQPVCLDERKKGVNNDKTDAMELCTRLDRYVAGNKRALALVRVPTPQEEQKRIHSRQREQLKREIKRVASQGRSVMLTQGLREKGHWWRATRWPKLSPRLPAWLVQRLETFRRVLDVLEKEEALLRDQIEGAAPKDLPKGMGAFTLEAIQREVGNFDRFENRRQVGSYAGLCGGVSSSGQSTRLLSITKHGNQRLRTLLVELAWRMWQWQPQCHAVRGWRDQLSQGGSGKASARKKAIVAVARQLIIDIWRWRTGRATAEQLGWVAAAA